MQSVTLEYMVGVVFGRMLEGGRSCWEAVVSEFEVMFSSNFSSLKETKMKKTIVGTLLLLSAGAASAATVDGSFSISPGTEVNFSTRVGSGETLMYGLDVGSQDVNTTITRLTPSSDTHSVQYALYETGFEGDVDLSGKTPSYTGTNLLLATLTANTDYVLKMVFDMVGTYRHQITAAAVPAVPLPAAAWLFGSALLGFMMMSNRRKV